VCVKEFFLLSGRKRDDPSRRIKGARFGRKKPVGGKSHAKRVSRWRYMVPPFNRKVIYQATVDTPGVWKGGCLGKGSDGRRAVPRDCFLERVR